MNCLTLDNIVQNYQCKKIDFLTFHRLKSGVTLFLFKYYNPNNNNDIIYHRPHRPFYQNLIQKNKKGNRQIYYVYESQNANGFSSNKWNLELELDIDSQTWCTAFTKCFTTVKNNYLSWHCYKILTRALGCNYMIDNMKISNTPSVEFVIWKMKHFSTCFANAML